MAKELAVITGGTKGLGLAVARRFLHEGLDVLLTYASDSAHAAGIAQRLTSEFPTRTVRVLRADATDIASVGLIEEAVAATGRSLRALVLNAGLTDRGSLEELDYERWRRVFDANVNVPVFTIQRLLPHFTDSSSIVFTGSAMGIHPHSMSLAYGASKASVHALAKNLVKFLAPRGIRVNAVAPGFIDTEWQLSKPAEIRDSINTKIALHRFAQPQEIADIYWTLVENSYINGEIITVDGGYSFH